MSPIFSQKAVPTQNVPDGPNAWNARNIVIHQRLMNGFRAEFAEVALLLEELPHLDDSRFHKWIKPIRGLLLMGSLVGKIDPVEAGICSPLNPFFNGFFVPVQPPRDFTDRNPCARQANHFLTNGFVGIVRFFS